MSSSAPNFKHQDSQPWYKNYMVVIFVIGMPAFVVIACIWFVYYSYQIRDSVVRDDWYMDGKTLYHDVAALRMTRLDQRFLIDRIFNAVGKFLHQDEIANQQSRHHRTGWDLERLINE